MTIRRFCNRLLMLYGIPTHLDGFAYIVDAVEMMQQNPEVAHGLTKNLYPYIGKMYGVSGSAVEKAIRTAIKHSGLGLTNKEFLTMIIKVYEVKKYADLM